MQAQKEAPTDMQCKDKFLLQSVVVSPGTTAKDITPEMVISCISYCFVIYHWVGLSLSACMLSLVLVQQGIREPGR